MKLALKKASTNVSVYLFIQDSSATDGSGLTGLVYDSGSLVASYVRPLAARAAITLATQTVTGAYSAGGFVEVDSSNMPGVYRLDLPDAVCATGVNSVVVMLKGATNMAPVVLEIQLTGIDVNDAVRGGMTALPNAAANAAGGLPVSAAGGLAMDGLSTLTSGQVTTAIETYDPPTKAELDSGLDGLNDLSAADVNAEIDAALADYGPPTLAQATALVANVLDDTVVLLSRLSAARAAKLDNLDATVSSRSTLTAIQVNAEVDAALETYGLDHLVAASVAGADVTDNSIIAKLTSKEATADWDDFVNTTDSLQAIRDNMAGADAAAIADAIWDELLSGHTDAGSTGKALADAGVSVILGAITTARVVANRLSDPIELEAHAKAVTSFALSVYDADGNKIGLSGRTLRWTAFDANDPPTGKIQKDEGDGIVVSGASNEVATVTIDATDSANTTGGRKWKWQLWDTVASTVLLWGWLEITTSVETVA